MTPRYTHRSETSVAAAQPSTFPEMIAKIEAAAGFLIIDRSGPPLSPTDAGGDFIREAHQILQAAREQTAAIQ